MLIEKLKSLNKSNIGTIFKGNFLAKFVLVVGGLILAKYYGVENFGDFSVYLSVTLITNVLLSFATEHLIMLETNKKNSVRHFNAGNFISLIVTFTTLIIILIIKQTLAYYLGVISGFFCVFTHHSKTLFSKLNYFKPISFLIIVDAVISFFAQCLFLSLEINNGLIWGSFIGFSGAFIYSLILSRKWLKKPNFYFYFSSLKEKKELLLIEYPSNFINALGNNIMPILMAFYFSSKILGEYAMSVKILSVPLLMISSSIAVTYYPKAVEIHQQKSIKSLYNYTKKMSSYNFWVILVLFILINSIGIYILGFLFDEDWGHLSLFTLILSFGFLFRSLINPIADVLTVVKKNHVTLYFNCYLLLSNLIAIYLGKEKGFTMLVLSFSFFLSLGYGVLYSYIMLYLKRNEHH